jgi:branched-chain amino acid transport system substrate-binding protein
MVRYLLSLLLLAIPAAAYGRIPDNTIKIGILQDLPGPEAGTTGRGGLVAAQLAASDFEREFLRGSAEILPGVTHTTRDAEIAQVRDWLDKEDVDAVLSSAGPAVNQQVAALVAQRHRTLLIVSSNDDVTGKLCSPNVVVWGTGPEARARALAETLVPRNGKRWYVVARQGPLAVAGQAALQLAVGAMGGRIVGETDTPGSAGPGQIVPKITASHAQVVALTESDGSLVDVLRSAEIAGLARQVTLTALFAQIPDLEQAGVTGVAGLVTVAPFYWDTDATSRRFSQRWSGRMQGLPVSGDAPEAYAGTLSFLRAAKAADDVDAAKVGAELRRAPIAGTLFGTVTIRNDGRVVHDLSVYRVKSAQGTRHPRAYYTKIATISGARAFPPEACGEH